MAEFKKDFLTLTSLQLTAPPPEGAKRPAKLQVRTWNNKVSLTAFTGVENAPRKGIVGLNLYPLMFMQVLNGLEEIARSEYIPDQAVKHAITVYDNGSSNKKEIGKVTYGRNKNGVCFISVTVADPESPKVVFPIRNAFNYQVEGENLSNADASRLATLGWVDLYRNTIPQYLVDNYVDESQNNNGGYNKGGYNKNNNGGGKSYNADMNDLDF